MTPVPGSDRLKPSICAGSACSFCFLFAASALPFSKNFSLPALNTSPYCVCHHAIPFLVITQLISSLPTSSTSPHSQNNRKCSQRSYHVCANVWCIVSGKTSSSPFSFNYVISVHSVRVCCLLLQSLLRASGHRAALAPQPSRCSCRWERHLLGFGRAGDTLGPALQLPEIILGGQKC